MVAIEYGVVLLVGARGFRGGAVLDGSLIVGLNETDRLQLGKGDDGRGRATLGRVDVFHEARGRYRTRRCRDSQGVRVERSDR